MSDFELVVDVLRGGNGTCETIRTSDPSLELTDDNLDLRFCLMVPGTFYQVQHTRTERVDYRLSYGSLRIIDFPMPGAMDITSITLTFPPYTVPNHMQMVIYNQTSAPIPPTEHADRAYTFTFRGIPMYRLDHFRMMFDVTITSPPLQFPQDFPVELYKHVLERIPYQDTLELTMRGTGAVIRNGNRRLDVGPPWG